MEKNANLDLKQKARIKWEVDGDENSRFFHGIVDSRCRKNRINGVSVGGCWITDPQEIKNEAMRFFELKFTEPSPSRPKLVSPLFKTIGNEDASILEAPFSIDEIKSAVWACGSDKAPGPDSFNFKFFETVINFDATSWSWRRSPRHNIELNELHILQALCSTVTLNGNLDSWTFPQGENGRFSVSSLRRLIEPKLTSAVADAAPWIGLVPPRVNCFVWRAKQSRIPTLSALADRGIIGNSQVCVSCNRNLETADHLLITCPTIKSNWAEIFAWCGIPHREFSSLDHLFKFIKEFGNNKKDNHLFATIVYATLWNL